MTGADNPYRTPATPSDFRVCPGCVRHRQRHLRQVVEWTLAQLTIIAFATVLASLGAAVRDLARQLVCD